MYRKATVFILGAGASCHYGYPTGATLVGDVLARARQLSALLEFGRGNGVPEIPLLVRRPHLGAGMSASEYNGMWRDAIKRCDEAARRIEDALPLVIDYFLGLNEEIEELGRFLIAWVILEKQRARYDGKTKWHRFVLSRLFDGCHESADLLQNRVRFVTFNYDVSLDRALYEGLRAHSFFKEEHIRAFMQDRVIHLYGSISADPHAGNSTQDFSVLTTNQSQHWHRAVALLDLIYEASKKLRVIAPKEKATAEFDQAFELIRDAEIVYILGYGFDDTNSQRLRLREALGSPRPNVLTRSVLFTNLHDANQINKKVSRLFLGNPRNFLDDYIVDGTNSDLPYFEKSIRDCYDALALDFDALGDEVR